MPIAVTMLAKFSLWTKTQVARIHKMFVKQNMQMFTSVQQKNFQMFDPHLILQELSLMRLYPQHTYKRLEADFFELKTTKEELQKIIDEKLGE